MRLINTETGKFENFVEGEIPRYAILSHTWDKDGEQTYQDVVKIQEKYCNQPPPPKNSPLDSYSDDEVPTCSESGSEKSMSSENPHSSELEAGASRKIQSTHTSPTTHRSIWDPDSGLSKKVRRACKIARRDGYRYIWIDSCCINKESSSELSEAINSMFNWYRAAQICYAFLVDVPSDKDPSSEVSEFRKSRWFKRGWTLQELVAPLFVVFFSGDWKGLGNKKGLAKVIQEVTSIDVEILTHGRALSDESVANRMGWASKRETTRVEDRAYSLLGIFGITMPTLYGEGEYAFRRLQEEILRRIPDQTIFAWGCRDVRTFPMTSCEISCHTSNTSTLLASSPSQFTMELNQIIPATQGSIMSIPLPVEEYTHTPYGIRTQLCLLPLQRLNPSFKVNTYAKCPEVSWYLAILRAQKATAPQGLLGQLCYLQKSDKANVDFLYLCESQYKGELASDCLYELSMDVISRVGELETHLKTVYLPNPKPSEFVSMEQLQDFDYGSFRVLRSSLTIPVWVHHTLSHRGFKISNIQGPMEHDPNSYSFTLLHDRFKIHILYQHAANPSWLDKYNVVIKACSWILPPGNEPLHTSVIQLSPPLSSATWVQAASDMTLPLQCLVLRMTDEDEHLVTVLLSLRLDLTAPCRYNIHFDPAPKIYLEIDEEKCTHLLDIRPHSGLELELPYKTLDFIFPGSLRMSLQKKGYSVHLSLKPSLGDTHSHLLTLSTNSDWGKFSIVVKYLQVHTLDKTILARKDLKSASKRDRKTELIFIVARITVESSDGAFKTVHDGPHVVAWSDYYPWKRSPGQKDVVLTTPAGYPLTLQLGFNLAWLYQYYLHVDVSRNPSNLSSTPTRITNCNHESDWLPVWAHRGISLTLPTYVNRALQAQGFQVRFEKLEGGGASGDPIHHLLTLSHTPGGFGIVIKYLHSLITDYADPHSGLNDPEVKERYPLLQSSPQLASDSSLPAPTTQTSVKRCHQKLTLKASVQMSTSCSVPMGDTPSLLAVCDDDTTVEMTWEEGAIGCKWYYGEEFGWKQHLRKDVMLTVPTGRQFVLRLGFDLVWYSEYCLVVEINPRMPLPFRHNPPPMPDYELSDDGMEYIQQSSAEIAELGVGQSAEAPNDNPEPLPVDLRMLEESLVQSGEPEDTGNSEGEERPMEGVVVEAHDEATELLTRLVVQSNIDDDQSDAVRYVKRRRVI